MKSNCKKCLLYEAGEKVTYDEIMRYVSTLDEADKISEDEYIKRISHCKNCDYLISGMCIKCGCYVEVRARLKDKNCPDINEREW